MDPITSTLLAGTVIVIGRISQGKGMDAKGVVGIVGMGLFLSLIGEADEGLGKAFAGLILVTSVFMYGVPILQTAGLIEKPKK